MIPEKEALFMLQEVCAVITNSHIVYTSGKHGSFAEQALDGNKFVIKRGYDKLVFGKSVLIVEDILNTGGSVRKVVEAVRRTGGRVVAVAAFLCNRGCVTKKRCWEFATPFYVGQRKDGCLGRKRVPALCSKCSDQCRGWQRS